jgi:hypothetical protein
MMSAPGSAKPPPVLSELAPAIYVSRSEAQTILGVNQQLKALLAPGTNGSRAAGAAWCTGCLVALQQPDGTLRLQLVDGDGAGEQRFVLGVQVAQWDWCPHAPAVHPAACPGARPQVLLLVMHHGRGLPSGETVNSPLSTSCDTAQA